MYSQSVKYNDVLIRESNVLRRGRCGTKTQNHQLMSHRSHGNRSSESPHIWKALRCKKGKSWNQLNCLWTALFGMATNEWFFLWWFLKNILHGPKNAIWDSMVSKIYLVKISKSSNSALHGKKTISPHASQTWNLNWVCSQESLVRNGLTLRCVFFDFLGKMGRY